MMTNASLRCADCDRPLEPDDRFCARCGAPVPFGDDPDATIVVESADAGAGPPARKRGTPVPEVVQAADGPATGTSFRARLRRLLGAEYEVLKLVGKGGFARVYRARDRRLNRLVAIKVIRPDLTGDEAFVENFRSEGIALAELRHPGIIPIYDIRERDGLIWYVMPFVEGTTLEARLQRGRMAPVEARRILSELADALSAVHRVNMVHLDIKPANVFLEGDLQKVLLTDFGTARSVAAQVPDGSDDVVTGTPAFMSPEQARGLPEIDHRSDIYSLGALGYQMLMGRPPFTGGAQAVLEQHVTGAPVPIRDVRPTIPKDFADAIMRCLEKDPWQRYSTAKEVRAALDLVSFFGATRDTRSQTPPGGAPGWIVAIAAVAALLLGLFVGMAMG